MSLTDAVREHVKAGFAGLYVKTYEPDDAEQEIGALCMAQGWDFHRWDIDGGLDGTGDSKYPVQCMQAIRGLAGGKPTLIILRYFGKFLNDPEVISALENTMRVTRGNGPRLVIVAPEVNLPIEVSRAFTVLNHDLPNREALLEIAKAVGTEPGELPDGSKLETLIDASRGLTRIEASDAFSLSLIRHQSIKADEVFKLKSQALEKSGLLSLHEGKETIDDLCGLDNLKSFCIRLVTPSKTRKNNPKGIILLGVPGTGKSHFARSLGATMGIPTVTLDVGALMGSLVGETEERTRQAIAMINAMGPCVVFLDELEKSLSGGTSGGGDSGTSKRQFGSLLSWLSDPNKKAFVIATSNDIASMPKEFVRPGRFNGVFFLDYPDRAQKDAIWEKKCMHYGLTDSNRPNDSQWTGAEIELCCEMANQIGATIADSANYVIPVSTIATEQIEDLRQWASGRCLDANIVDGTYQRNPTQSTQVRSKSVRQIDRSN